MWGLSENEPERKKPQRVNLFRETQSGCKTKMSTTLPQITAENKRKTIAELAQEQKPATPTAKPPKQQHHQSRGAAMNTQFEVEYFAFVGNAVEVKTADGEVFTGILIAATPYGHIIVKTGSHKIIIKTWQYMKRAAGGDQK